MKLNLGSGKDYRPGYVNVDCSEIWGPDIVLDLETPHWGQALSDSLRAPIWGRVSEILAYDLLEHIVNLTAMMGICRNALAPGAVMRIQVRYDLSYGAWQDPTHVRAFNERSWVYYYEWAWYLGWTNWGLRATKLEFGLSDTGRKLVETGRKLEEILPIPRRVDSMRLELTKERLPHDNIPDRPEESQNTLERADQP